MVPVLSLKLSTKVLNCKILCEIGIERGRYRGFSFASIFSLATGVVQLHDNLNRQIFRAARNEVEVLRLDLSDRPTPRLVFHTLLDADDVGEAQLHNNPVALSD